MNEANEPRHQKLFIPLGTPEKSLIDDNGHIILQFFNRIMLRKFSFVPLCQ